jgi:hypothetical protein
MTDDPEKLAEAMRQKLIRDEIKLGPSSGPEESVPSYIVELVDSLLHRSVNLATQVENFAVALDQGEITEDEFLKYFAQIPLIPSEEIQLLFRAKIRWKQ